MRWGSRDGTGGREGEGGGEGGELGWGEAAGGGVCVGVYACARAPGVCARVRAQACLGREPPRVGVPGTLGRVCLEEGWDYFAVCRRQAHSSFIQNRLDRDALTYITREGSTLYEADMAKHIKDHFADVLEQYTVADVVDEDQPDEEDEQMM